MFIGREEEFKKLNIAYNSTKSELVALYGRRRIGKSALIKKFSNEKDNCIHFEGLEGAKTKEQINHFMLTLSAEVGDIYIRKINFDNWHDVFDYFTTKHIINRDVKSKLIISFDEIQWMAMQRSELISLIKFYWDKYWKDNNVMLILCGSIASFMVNKVLKSKALYGRISLEILLRGLKAKDMPLFFKGKRSKEEILQYLMIFGGVPKYLEEINLNNSFSQNVNSLCFSQNGLMINELEKMFYSQFKEVKTYLKIVRLLKDGLFSLKEISEKLNITSGGALRSYLTNLENADMIQQSIPFNKKLNSKMKKYYLSDEFLRFYFKFIEPNKMMIENNTRPELFDIICGKQFTIWSGFAFEKFCIKNSSLLAEIMDFNSKVILASPFFGKSDSKFQIDLLFLRSDKVITVCEIKYRKTTINIQVIEEVQKKIELLDIPKGYSVETALISLYGMNKQLKDSNFFHHEVTLNQILKEI